MPMKPKDKFVFSYEVPEDIHNGGDNKVKNTKREMNGVSTSVNANILSTQYQANINYVSNNTTYKWNVNVNKRNDMNSSINGVKINESRTRSKPQVNVVKESENEYDAMAKGADIKDDKGK